EPHVAVDAEDLRLAERVALVARLETFAHLGEEGVHRLPPTLLVLLLVLREPLAPLIAREGAEETPLGIGKAIATGGRRGRAGRHRARICRTSGRRNRPRLTRRASSTRSRTCVNSGHCRSKSPPCYRFRPAVC